MTCGILSELLLRFDNTNHITIQRTDAALQDTVSQFVETVTQLSHPCRIVHCEDD